MTLTWSFWLWGWEQWATFFILAAAPVQAMFVVLYFLFSPWWAEPIGRALMAKSGALALVLSMIFVAYFWHVRIPRPIASAVYGLTFFGVCWQFAVFLRLRFGEAEQTSRDGIWYLTRRRLARR